MHLRKDCENEKVTWNEYIKRFKQKHPEIPDHFYGKWYNLALKHHSKCPTEKDFNLPTSKEEWEEMKAMF